MSPPLFLVDSFTAEPFRGNPAGVCLLPAWKSDAWLQGMAAELNAAETAFLVARGSTFELRWFTPLVEVPLCGHATLAAAHVLFETGRAADPPRVEFDTLSGRLAAERREHLIELDFPVVPVEVSNPPDGLIGALGVEPLFVGITAARPTRADANYFCVLESASAVETLQPDIPRLKALGVSVIVTARGAGAHAIVSRYFAPAVGIDEDPVTGSAHCALASYWAPRLGLGRFLARQASRRGGEIVVTLRGDRVGLGGGAVTIWSGHSRV